MSRVYKIIRNIIVIAILFIILLLGLELHLTPLSAHRHSERSAHYGPSEVAHIESFKGGKYILGKYDKWVSCNTINRVGFVFWRFGNQVHGFEVDMAEPVSYTWGRAKLYGIINNPDIEKVAITLDNAEILSATDFYDGLFLITWDDKYTNLRTIKAYDSNGSVVFVEEFGG